ncbi:efflux RND transporter periplasmic adaptor subunit [candidate division KSB1 bacterium]
MKKFVIIIIVLFIGGAGYVVYRQLSGGSSDFNFRTAVVERSDISKTVVATGKVEPKSQIDIKSKIGGIISTLYVEEGDVVHAGQKLVDIIPGATPVELVKARDDVRNAALIRENAKTLYERSQELVERNLIPKQEFDNIRTDYETANSRFYSAMAQLQVLERGSGASGFGEEFELTEEDNAAIAREAKDAINSMSLVAPINGIVLSKERDEGTTVTPISSAQGGTVIMVLADISQVLFKGDVDEADIGKIKTDTPVRIHVEAYIDKEFSGNLYKISPLGREINNVVNFKVEAEIVDPERLLRVGMSADAEIVLEEHFDVLVAPEGTIYYDEENPYVYAVDTLSADGRVRKDITVGISNGIITQIHSGLTEGEKVIFKQ